MFINQVKDVGACENRRRLFFRPASFVILLRYLTKFGEEAGRERQLLTPLYCSEPSDCEADADDVRRVGGIWMMFNEKGLSESCLSKIFPDLNIYTYKIAVHDGTLFSSCLFIPINRPAMLSEHEAIIDIFMKRVEYSLNLNLENQSASSVKLEQLVRKPLASDWFPLPYNLENSSQKTYRFFEGKARFPIDVTLWTSLAR